jgi:hypothetical protein
LTVNDNIGPRELALYRIGFMLANYIVGYLRYPSRVWRTIRNILISDDVSATVFEHRVKDALRKFAARG